MAPPPLEVGRRCLLLPRIDQVDAETLEVARVACGESRLAAAHNAGDLNIAYLHRATGKRPSCCDRAGGVSGCAVKELHAAVEILD